MRVQEQKSRPRKDKVEAQLEIADAQEELLQEHRADVLRGMLKPLEYDQEQIPAHRREWFRKFLARAREHVYRSKQMTHYWESFIGEIERRGVIPTVLTIVDMSEDSDAKDRRRDAGHYWILMQMFTEPDDVYEFLIDTLNAGDESTWNQFPLWYRYLLAVNL